MDLHPVLAALQPRLARRPLLSAGTPDEARAAVAAGRKALGAGPDMAACRDLDVPCRAGTVRTRVLVPRTDPLGVVVYLHGGGWLLGAIEDFEPLGRTLAQRSGCVVLLPDYRLAPEHRFPAALEDCQDILVWAAREAASFAGSGAPLIVAGDSAGANLATVAARRLRDTVRLAQQILVYPIVDCDFETSSYRRYAALRPLTRADMLWFFGHYAPAERWAEADIAPLRAPDLAGLAPASIVTAEHDVLADEGIAYAAKLRAAGVTVTERRVPGVTHGFLALHNMIDVADATVSAIAEDIAAACRAARSAAQ